MKKAISICCFFLLISFFAAALNLVHLGKAATEVTGVISADTTGTKANSPYNLTGHILVDEGVTLIIEPGVTVNFNGYFMNVGGSLSAIGNETEKIIMTGSEMSYSGEWMGRIYFLSTSNDSIIEHAEITSAVDYDKILVKGNSTRICNNILTNVSVGIIDCSPIIAGNIIRGNLDRGITVTGTSVREPVLITGNTITNNGVGVYLSYDASSPIVSGNDISDNIFGIISDCMWSNATVTNNLIMNNRGCLEHGYPAGIITEGAGILILSAISYGVDIGNNTIYRNEYGISIRGSPYTVITQNNILENDDYDVFNDLPDDINASNNWWGSTNTSTIDQSIYDLYDDFNLGEVTYLPFLNQSNTNAPAIPSLAPWINNFNVSVETQSYNITVLSNSTISEFNFNQDLKEVRFNADGLTGTTAICNITIPSDLMFGTFSLYKNDELLIKDVDYTENFNTTHYIFQIFYNHSAHTIKIVSSQIIPDLPTNLLTLLIIISLSASTLILRKNLPKRKTKLQ